MASPMPETKNPAALPRRLPTLTGMRALAAGTVFLSHVWIFNFFASPPARDTANKVLSVSMHGFIGVSFFFILSGFVLTWAARDTDAVTSFWRRRALKIYPNHILTFIAAFALFVFVAGESVNPVGAVVNLLLLHAWFPQVQISYNLNVVAWTLSCEFLFYALFPVILPLVNRVREGRLWLWCGVMVAITWVIPALAMIPDPGPTSFPGLPPDFQFWAVYILPASRLPEFVLGMLLAKVVASGRRIPVGIGGGFALTLVAGLASTLLPLTYQLVAIWVVPLGLTVAAGAVADAARRPTFLSRRTMVWLGEISFAFYLWHFLILVTGRSAGPPDGFATPVAIAVLVVLLGVIVLVSWATFTFFERPIMRRFADPAGRAARPTGAQVESEVPWQREPMHEAAQAGGASH